MPHYQVEYKVHLPADPPYRREPRNMRRIATATSPENLWVGALKDLTELMGFGHNTEVLIGLLLNMVNTWPDGIRATLAAGIVDGLGMTLVRDGENLSGEIHTKFDSLVVDGEKRTASGLVVPGK